MPISQVPTTVSHVVVPSSSPVPVAATATQDTAGRFAGRSQAVAADAAASDAWTQSPSPPRFPWLSRVTWQSEEAAARKRPVFDDAPVIGDQLNLSA